MCTSYFIEPVQWMEQAMLGVMDGQVTQFPIFSDHNMYIHKVRQNQIVRDTLLHKSNSVVTLLFPLSLHLAVVSQV